MTPFLHSLKLVLRPVRPNKDKMITQAIFLALAIVLLDPFASAQWTQIGLSDRGIGEIAVGSSGVFVITSDIGSVFRSTDGGANWLQVVPFGGTHIAVAPNGTIIMSAPRLVTDHDTLYRSTDGGIFWNMLPYPDTTLFWAGTTSIAVGPNGGVFWGGFTLFLAGPYSLSAMSADNGLTWTAPKLNNVYGMPPVVGDAFAFNGSSVMSLGRTSSGGGRPLFEVDLSTDAGQTWEPRRKLPPYLGPYLLVWCSNRNILAYWGDSLAMSADTGASWSLVSSLNAKALLALPQNGVLVGTDTTGIYLFSDDGDSIKTLNEGLTDLHVHAFALDSSGYVYVGTNKGIWRRPVSQVVSVSQQPEFPNAFRLEQNYPNPFNPTTVISYQLSAVSEVRLVVYDLLGREVAVLVNQRKAPGSYDVTFNGSNLASGVYFCRLQAGDLIATKKLVLLK